MRNNFVQNLTKKKAKKLSTLLSPLIVLIYIFILFGNIS